MNKYKVHVRGFIPKGKDSHYDGIVTILFESKEGFKPSVKRFMRDGVFAFNDQYYPPHAIVKIEVA